MPPVSGEFKVMSRTVLRFLTFAAAAAALSACSTISSIGGLDGGYSGSGGGYASGSALAYSLTGADERALEDAFLLAMETGQPQEWQGRRAKGVVSPGDYSLGNLKSDPGKRVILDSTDVAIDESMETELGLYALTGNANVRTGPGTDYGVVKKLPSGEGVDVVGRVVGEPWMLVAHEGRVIGYIHESLMIKAPGTELDLAGGPRRRPVLCREFNQHVSVDDQEDDWTGGACNDGTGWRMAPEPAVSDEDDGLAGF